MKTEQEVWKVVHRENTGTLRSFITQGVLSLRYEVGKSRKGYLGTPLLAFSSLEAAQDFNFRAGSDSQRRIYRCKARNVRKISIRSSLGLHNNDILAFWQNPRRVRKVGWAVSVPPGTVACDEIALLEEVCFG